ncbi:MAG: hypothetical protein KUA35_01395 [Pseudodesulfovibrio sp.]|uniref:Uncharacterized protein n=1 Tax=Pseudodesulfovibrio aespoeensis (strain ATCC 700646 / DSM 10631 / Aspo-2) TaxID=643562 RepID=E6VSE5_PSEA9|nr:MULTISPECIES: hypothetical protein [Pseudodesulfovibrio]MBU4192148.1 hypothetical protein [Pseudomonadota bacterium]ADU64288.1 hypothetical protein Daes_3300 [Pseudodesulfovibrio aespoeensis Aspo-2]MBU4242913.1 hypothetical protein [Pseudomonadota bacterium]MBU4378955.1 hypothetical protein [Pseudomonadota bacterium]MBU4474232.1 hypothetical protein [Pseudomonadota bacterium]
MRTIFLTLLLLLLVSATGQALDTYSDDAPLPATTPAESTTPDGAEPKATESAPGATESAMEAASEDEIDPDQTGAAPEMTPEEARQASETDEENQEDEAGATEAQTPATQGYTSVISDNLRLEPLGSVTLNNGTVHNIMDFQKLGKYFIYIAGKLNGRSSTIISLTRLTDLQNWSSIAFKDPHTFTIVDKKKKELFFAESRLYLGTDSPATYTFISMNPNNFQPEVIEVNKRDVKSIVIN